MNNKRFKPVLKRNKNILKIKKEGRKYNSLLITKE